MNIITVSIIILFGLLVFIGIKIIPIICKKKYESF